MVGYLEDTAAHCFTEQVGLSVDFGVPPYDFRWASDSLISGVRDGRAELHLDSTGSYLVHISDAANQQITIPFDMQIDSLPNASFDVVYPLPHWVDFVGKKGHQFWNWDFGDGSSSSGRLAYHFYHTGGNYQVKLVVRNACGMDSSYRRISLTVGMPNTAFARSVRLSPSPMREQCKIQFDNPEQTSVSLVLFNLQGQKLRAYPPTRGN
jgi:hypothetical protein